MNIEPGKLSIWGPLRVQVSQAHRDGPAHGFTRPERLYLKTAGWERRGRMWWAHNGFCFWWPVWKVSQLKVKAHSSMDTACPLVYSVLAGPGPAQAAMFLFLEFPSHDQLPIPKAQTPWEGSQLLVECGVQPRLLPPFWSSLWRTYLASHLSPPNGFLKRLIWGKQMSLIFLPRKFLGLDANLTFLILKVFTAQQGGGDSFANLKDQLKKREREKMRS